MTALISIHPEFVSKILTGQKVFEFRRKGFREDVKRIVIYSTSPISAIVAIAEVEIIHEGTPEAIWQKCAERGGIDAEGYFTYFQGSDTAFAIEFSVVHELNQIVKLESLSPGLTPPQSFVYLRNSEFECLESLEP